MTALHAKKQYQTNTFYKPRFSLIKTGTYVEATATIMNTAKDGSVGMDNVIMFNITGGGEERFKSEHNLQLLKPSLVFDIDPAPEEVKVKLERLFQV